MDSEHRPNHTNDTFPPLTSAVDEAGAALQATFIYGQLESLYTYYMDHSKSQGIIEVARRNDALKLAANHFRDLIDIYFYHHRYPRPESPIFIEIIEFLGADFYVDAFDTFETDDAFDYLDKFAYSSRPEQFPALKLLLLLAAIRKRDDITIQKIQKHFRLFDDRLKRFVNGYAAAVFRNETIVFTEKRWWQFWR